MTDDAHEMRVGTRDELVRELPLHAQRRAMGYDDSRAPVEHPKNINDFRRKGSAKDVMRRLGVDPLTYLADVMRDEAPFDVVKVSIARELLPYAYPKLKQVEHVGDAGRVVISIGGDARVTATQVHDDDGIEDAECTDDRSDDNARHDNVTRDEPQP